jgi:hypothetical protein
MFEKVTFENTEKCNTLKQLRRCEKIICFWVFYLFAISNFEETPVISLFGAFQTSAFFLRVCAVSLRIFKNSPLLKYNN